MKAFRLAVAALIASSMVVLGCIHARSQIHQNSKQVQEEFDGMIGHDKSDLIGLLGEPNRADSDGKDGVVLIWDEFHGGWLFPGGTAVVSDIPVPVPAFRGGDYTQSVMFYVHADGTIYDWHIQKSQ
jgi:hypothetical protein